MAGISDSIIRLSTPEGSGSGFVFNPGDADDDVYIITARHCLHSKAGIPWAAHEITIGHLTTEITEYPIPEIHPFLYGSNNHTEDIGMIIISKSALPPILTAMAPKSLAFPPHKKTNAQVIGFPFVALNERKRSLYRLDYLSDQDYPMQLQFELQDRLSEEFNDDILVEGYSGSPILLQSGQEQYICGIFLEYEDKLKRVIGFDLSLLNRLLLEQGKPGLHLKAVETDPITLEDIGALQRNTQRVAGRIRDKIGTLHLPREAVALSVRNAIAAQQMVLLSGWPGSGKSAITRRVLSEMTDYELIAVQGEQLDKGSIAEIFSGGAFQLRHPLETLLDSPGLKTKKILLIDSIEKILETAHAETILDFFDLIARRPDIKLVLTCRSYALDTLKLRFLQQFPPHLPLEVGLLNDEELKLAGDAYPALKALLDKPNIRPLLRIPFNLDKAAALSGEQVAALQNEQEFKNAMWSLVIENLGNEPDAAVRSQRGRALMAIAIKRAEQMSPYITIPDLHPQIVQQLAADQVIDLEPGDGQGYAAAHDIYEDWALTRYIGQLYHEEVLGKGSVEQFFQSLGNAASIRRSFRLWVTEQVQAPDLHIRDTIRTALNNETVATYWQDELLIAILQNDYSQAFLEEEKALLFAQDHRVYKRCLVLLNVACQEPDFRYLPLFKPEEKMQLYHRVNLVPFGAGWANMINLSFAYLEELAELLPLTINMVLQWKKGISDGALPREAKNAGHLVLRYLADHTKEYSDRVNRSGDADNIEECLRLLFRLSGEVKAETEALIRQAMGGKKEGENWRLRNFYEKIIELAMSGYEDEHLCRNFPELIIELAEKEWFYVAPTEAELDVMFAGAPFLRGTRSGLHQENDFGLKESTHMDYFPSGYSHSPLLHLLYAKPVPALRFIIKVMNHAADSYWASDFGMDSMFLPAADNRVMVTFTLADGTEISQKGSMTLWNVYRGNYIATPNLLESVLMALEYWLLELGRVITNAKSEETRTLYQSCFDLAYRMLLRESNNVSTTAVLLSVAYAYRELARPYILPVLTVREFYYWDYVRLKKERDSLAPLGSRGNAILHQRQQFAFNKMEHRKHDLRYLVLNLSIGADQAQVFALLDRLYALDPADTEWQLQVNSMDARRWELAGDHPDGILVQPRLEGEMLTVVEESRRETERNEPARAAINWSLVQWEEKPEAAKDYTEWEKHYEAYLAVADDDTVTKINKMPGILAGLGIRDYAADLNEQQKIWCAELVIAITVHELKRPRESVEDLLHPEYNTFEVDAAFYTLPQLMLLSRGEQRQELREQILYALLMNEEAGPRKELQKSLRDNGWAGDPQFLLNCISGMLQFGQVGHHRHIVANARQYPEFNKPYLQVLIKSNLKWAFRGFKGKRPRPANVRRSERIITATWQRIFKNLDENGTPFDFAAFHPGERDHFYFVFQSLKLIPADTSEPGLLAFYEILLRHLLAHVQGDEDDYRQRYHITHLQQFQKRFAQFLLKQPGDISGKYFDILIDEIYSGGFEHEFRDKKFELIKNCLDAVMIETWQVPDLAPRFWFLWHKLAGRILTTGIQTFSDKVLLDHYFFNTEATDWAPIHDQKGFYGQFIPVVKNVRSSARLLASIGFTEMMPEGINWLAEFVGNEWPDEKNTLIWFERVIIRCFYTSEYRKMIKGSARLRTDFVRIVDHLIDKSASASAFLIREDFISRNPGNE